MAEIKVSQLPEASEINDNDLLMIVQSNVNKKITNANFISSNNLIDTFYPVGSIFINTTGVNPSTFMGGTWEAFGSGKVLVGQDTTDTDFDTLLETGGEKAVQLTTDNLASNVISTSTTGSNTDGYIMRGGYTASGTYNIGGSGVAHNNLQPYIVVSMWVRTA